MKKNDAKAIALAVALLILGGFFAYTANKKNNDALTEQKQQDAKVQGFLATTKDRVESAVLTLPPEDALVGLKDGQGAVRVDKDHSTAESVKLGGILATEFLPNIKNVRPARLDVLAPLQLISSTFGNHTYIILFQDRGDVALEESYADFGADATIESAIIIPAKTSAEDYEADMRYSNKTGAQEKIISVVGGHFNEPGASASAQNNTANATSTTTTVQKITNQFGGQIVKIAGYPASVYPIVSATARGQLAVSFNARNGSTCTAISDSFDSAEFIANIYCPFLDYTGKLDVADGAGILTTADISKITDFIKTNASSFGVTDANNFQLIPRSISPVLDAKAVQTVSGYDISQISVSKWGKTATITGHFYPHASLSTAPRLSTSDISAIFIGKDYSYPSDPCIDDFFGTCHPTTLTIKLTADNLKISLAPLVYTDKNTNSIELRLAYSVVISAPYTGGAGGTHTETKIIDAMTGEMLQ